MQFQYIAHSTKRSNGVKRALGLIRDTLIHIGLGDGAGDGRHLFRVWAITPVSRGGEREAY